MSTADHGPAQRGIIAWFAHNSVAANLLMILIFVVGSWSAWNIQRSINPKIEINIISVTMVYPGAAPEEVEKGIILKIEESLKDIESIKRVDATANESVASLKLEIYENFDVLATMDEVKSAIDSISSFPEEAEKPVVTRMQIREHASQLQIYGNLDEHGMKALVEEVKAELLQHPDIAYAQIWGDREYEIAIEVPEATLRKYNLTLDNVASAVRGSSLDLPGGAIKTDNGEIMLRTKGQAYQQQDFERIVLITYPDGTRLTLGDIASINDGFVEQEGFALFDNTPSMAVTIFAVGDQDILTVSRASKEYMEKKRQSLPPGVHIDHWADITFYLEGRLDMMIKNLAMGGLLVFLVLSLFLNIRLAFWVMAGLPVCFLGTFILMPYFDVTLNMISLFGFILILGIVVDDAIIIGESASSACEQNGHSINNVIDGALRVATPATFGVLTTIVAFMPTLFTEGMLSKFPESLGWVVIFCLVFSLIESKWILPAHLAHMKQSSEGIWGKLNKIPTWTNHHLSRFITHYYKPFLLKCIANRYTTFATFFAMLILVGGLVGGGIVRYVLFPAVPGDFLKSDLEMIEGSADWQTREAQEHIANSLQRLNERYKIDAGSDDGFIHHMFTWGFDGRFASSLLELTKSETRDITSDDIVKAWRDEVGDIPGAKVLSISNMEGMGGAAIGFKLVGTQFDQLKLAAAELEEKLASYNGLYDIRNGASAVRDEITLGIKPGAEALGLSMVDLGTQVRHAFYGAEAQRMQRETNEVKVMVRYPREERKTIANLENMYIRTNAGDEVPFNAVASVNVEPGYSSTTRINSERAITVSSEANKAIVEPSSVLKDITTNFMPELLQRYPGITYKLDGESDESNTMLSSLFWGFGVSLFGIYALLAIPLKSYLQPLIIMGVIPFGIIGAFVGHMLVGIPFDMFSFFGVIALSGVVVNDSLIMVDFVNKSVANGVEKREAVIDSGSKRFRAILLTSLTTFFGLLPMLLEPSLQAQMVIPMAVSLGFGIIFATVITLLLVPCLYIVLDDVDVIFSRMKRAVVTTADGI